MANALGGKFKPVQFIVIAGHGVGRVLINRQPQQPRLFPHGGNGIGALVDDLHQLHAFAIPQLLRQRDPVALFGHALHGLGNAEKLLFRGKPRQLARAKVQLIERPGRFAGALGSLGNAAGLALPRGGQLVKLHPTERGDEIVFAKRFGTRPKPQVELLQLVAKRHLVTQGINGEHTRHNARQRGRCAAHQRQSASHGVGAFGKLRLPLRAGLHLGVELVDLSLGVLDGPHAAARITIDNKLCSKAPGHGHTSNCGHKKARRQRAHLNRNFNTKIDR